MQQALYVSVTILKRITIKDTTCMDNCSIQQAKCHKYYVLTLSSVYMDKCIIVTFLFMTRFDQSNHMLHIVFDFIHG